MKQRVLTLGFSVIIALCLSACATSYQPVPQFTPVTMDTAGHALKTQNVVVVLDASSSMNEGHRQWKKLDIATATVRNMADSIPDNLGVQSALRIFGGDPGLTKKSTTLIDAMHAFRKTAFNKAVATVSQGGGTSPLAKALDGAGSDLQGLSGRSAVIIVSDGKSMGMCPADNAAALKANFGESLCIYPILVGDDADGQKLMAELARVGGCGFATNADRLAGGAQMADFVKKVFVGGQLDSDGDGVFDNADRCPGTKAGIKVDATGCPLDSDRDGVPDSLDKCPRTPAGLAVDPNGCALDSDRDGVPDSLDKCPGTAAGVKVDKDGCLIPVLDAGSKSWTFDNINFAVAKADIKPSSYGILNEIVAALEANPDLNVAIEGHTDSTGSHAFNMDLSKRRAQSVVDYLVGKGISPSRLTSQGYGPDRPIADNSSKAGRAKNRRVQFTAID